ncbi:MAG: methylisocitrate lyase [Phycisphaerales bacterium]|nr:methylisocitrate lyase [Phycisphaerales bacterium]
MSNLSAGARLREALAAETLMIPGAFNALVARAVAREGFKACYISGGASSNVAGYPDVGLLTLGEMCRTIREICDASALPVIADADTGFGEVECAVRTAVDYERAGAAALHIEDQVFPKRCGHLEGKELISPQDMADKISAMVSARCSRDFLIIGRTDARSVTGMDDAVARANLYREAGAEMVFPEGLADRSEFTDFARRSPGLLLANMTEFGKTEHIDAATFSSMGYSAVIYPLSIMRLAMKAASNGLSFLKANGTVEPLLGEMQTRQDLYDLLDYKPGRTWQFPRG